MKKGDILIIALVLLLSFGIFLFIPKGGDTVVITQNGKEIYRGKLTEDNDIIVPDAGVIRIKNGKAFMLEADCPDKTCINMGVATAAKPVVCMPNGIIISVEGKTDIDAVVY
ncbi:MAG: hypothetical protein BWY11_01652 [Firmicutes bacterium ADurb.Bin182]|nr:MAG: hypothetical protein BWY11_01652 [Firmicutes bacterium ADurb.Bin182]